MVLSWKRVGRIGLGCGENRGRSGFGRVRSFVSRWGSWWGGGARGDPGRSWELWLDTASKGSKTPINRWVNWEQHGGLRPWSRETQYPPSEFWDYAGFLMFVYVNKNPFPFSQGRRGENSPIFFPRFSPGTSFQFSVGTLRVIPVVWFQCNWAGHKNKLLHLAGFSRNVLLLSAAVRLGQKICAWFHGVVFSRYTNRCLMRSPCHSGPVHLQGVM